MSNCRSISFTEYIIIFYVALSVFPIAFSIIFLTSTKVSSDDWILAALIVLSLFLTLVVLGLLKFLVKYLHKKFDVETLKQKRNEMLIGLGGIALCSFIPQMLVFFFARNVPVLIYTAFLSFGSIFFFTLLFTYPRTKNYKMDYSIKGTCWLVASLLTFHILYLVFNIILGYKIYPEKHELATVIFVQLLYTLIFGFSTFEFIQVLRGGFKFDNGENRRVRYYNKYRNAGRSRNYGNRYESSGYSSGDMGMAYVYASASYGDCGGGYGGGYSGGDCGGGGGGGDCGGGDGGGGGGCD